MKITSKTLYKDFAPLESLMSDEEKQRLQEAAVADAFGEHGFWNMSIGEFAKCSTGDLSPLMTADDNCTVLQVYCTAAFVSFIDEFINVLDRISVKPTGDEIMAQSKCLKMGIGEGMTVFVREYFGLHSFAEAENLPLSDFLLAKKDTYNKIVMQKEFAKIQNQQMKRKK